MSVTFTNHSLEKIENLLKVLGYRLRYEKGNFKTGSCLIDRNKIIVINKFSNLDTKIISLMELIKNTDLDESLLDEKQKQYFYLLKQTSIEF